MKSSNGLSEGEMHGLHVLAIMPPAKKERTGHLVNFLEAGKARWDWRISVLCDGIEKRAFQDLTGATGSTIAKPHLLQAGDWEADPAQVKSTEASMRDAERVSGMAAGRIILAGAHSVGRGFNLSVRHIRKYMLVRRVTRDNTEAFRIVRRLYRFAEDILRDAKPDLVYTFEWATPLNLCIWQAARRHGIPCVALRYSKINPDQAFWTTDRHMMNSRAIELAGKRRESGAMASAEAHSRIAEFRDQPRVINYIANRWKNRTRRNFLRWHLENGRVVVREFINRFRGQDLALREPPLSRFLRYYHSLYLGSTHQRFFTTLDESALEDMKYVYFPLHKEAELAQTFQAPLWHDQRNTVRVLASLLPHGYRLLVREHRMNLGHRPTKSFRQYAALPNVTLIDPYDSQFKYLRHADLVVTENGSSGWEGAMLRRRVLTLARTFYDGAGLTTRVDDPDGFNQAILEALADEPASDPAEWDRALGCVLDAERETTFPMGKVDMSIALDQLQSTIGGGQQHSAEAKSDRQEQDGINASRE